MNALRLTTLAAMVAASFAAHADAAKPTQRTLTVKEAMLEAQRLVREQARDLRNSDMQAKVASGEISEVPRQPDLGPSSPTSGNGAGKR